MARNMIGTSVELTGEVTKAATKLAINGSGHLARRMGGNVVQRLHPGYISPEVLAQQAILKRFEGRLGVVGNLIDPDDSLEDDDELEARASSTAQTLVEAGVADPDTTVELRPILPQDAITNPVLNDRRHKVVGFLRRVLAQDHDITSIPMPDPIMPSARQDSPVNVAATWGAISTELGLLTNQLNDRPQRRPAMLALTGTPYSRATLESQTGERQHLERYGLLVLRRVGTLPEDNLLVEAEPLATA